MNPWIKILAQLLKNVTFVSARKTDPRQRIVWKLSKGTVSSHLVLPVVFLTEPQDPIAKPEDVLVGRVPGIRQLLDLEQGSIPVSGFDERGLEDPVEK